MLPHQRTLSQWKHGMKKLPAACAMDWSIQLEKGLRSKIPSERIDAVQQIGFQLLQWSREPPITMAVADMFELVPGEDRLFANTILLRLADAFTHGDYNMRASVLRIFLQELRKRKKDSKQYGGILSKKRVPNYLELLRRVKIVFDTDDVKSRALALRLLGCWADLAKDSADIRYMILCSIDSSHLLEVKASLFAAGCFCEVSEDFAPVVLEILIKMLASPNTSSDVKQAAVHTMAKMRSSCFAITRAYKAGKKLLLESSEEGLMIETLSSLSKLASKSVLLIHEQVELLLSIIGHETVSQLAIKALQYLRFLVEGGLSCFPISVEMLSKLAYVSDNAAFPLVSQCDALRVLHKFFSLRRSGHPHKDMSELVELLKIVEIAVQSRSSPKRLLACVLLVDISCNLKETCDHFSLLNSERDLNSMCHMDQLAAFLVRVVSSLTDCLALLMNQINACSGAEESPFASRQELQHLLSLALHLVEEYPVLGPIVLARIQCLIGELLNAYGKYGEATAMDVDPENPNHPISDSICVKRNKDVTNSPELVLCLCRFIVACLDILDEAGAITRIVVDELNHLIKRVKQSGVLDDNCCIIFCLFLHSHLMCCFSVAEVATTCGMNEELSESIVGCTYWRAEHEQMMLEFAKQLFSRNDFWGAYKTAKYASCQAAWFSATFVFGILMKKAKTHGYWLKSLALFAGAESEISLLLFPKLGLQLVNWLKCESGNPCGSVTGEIDQEPVQEINFSDYGEKLTRAYKRVCTAEEVLAGAKTSEGIHNFQRWFLCLRGKFLAALVDLIDLLSLEGNDRQKVVDGNGEPSCQYLEEHLTAISFRFNRLGKNYDLLAAIFTDMDGKSLRTISRSALICSLLAFSTAYALPFPKKSSELKKSLSVLLQDLVLRLWQIDRNICMELDRLPEYAGQSRASAFPCRAQMTKCGHRERAILAVSRFAIMAILQIHEAEKKDNNNKDLYHIIHTGLHLLINVTRKLMYIPFQTPKYFFRIRPCISAELFVFNAENQTSVGLSVLLGFQLSLNLCIQVKNMVPQCQVSTICCIISATQSDSKGDACGEGKEKKESGFDPWETDELVRMNDDLLLYMKEGVRKKRPPADQCGQMVRTFVSFRPNENGQGFANCLLDVSSFPEGSYHIIWCSCCIDVKGSYWGLLPLNPGPIFTICNNL